MAFRSLPRGQNLKTRPPPFLQEQRQQRRRHHLKLSQFREGKGKIIFFSLEMGFTKKDVGMISAIHSTYKQRTKKVGIKLICIQEYHSDHKTFLFMKVKNSRTI